jgi:hypothetical protein
MNAPGSVKAVGALLAAEFPRQVGRKNFKLGYENPDYFSISQHIRSSLRHFIDNVRGNAAA